MKIKIDDLQNFKALSGDDLHDVIGGFAIIPIISTALISLMTWKLFMADKGSVKFNGVGEAKWEDQNVKGQNINRVIYYPY